MTKTIRQTVTIGASPKAVYSALMDSRKHAQFTGAGAAIEAWEGGSLLCYDDYITGVTLELVPAKRIVQAWRAKNWAKGVYSIVTFALAKAGEGKTRLAFTQVGVPAGDYRDKVSGWKSHYWKPLKAYLEG